MGQRDDLVQRAVEGLEPVVVSQGWGPAEVCHDGLTSSVRFRGEDLALELAFDWRDFVVSILVVRLEDGALPEGYRVAHGRICRQYLLQALRELGWDTGRLGPRERSRDHAAEIQRDIEIFAEVLEDHAGRLQQVGAALFDD